MTIQRRLFIFVTRANWVLFFIASIAGLIFASQAFAQGIVFGGLIVTINFHLLSKTLKRALTPPYLASQNSILAKYYLRFIVSGVLLFFLIAGKIVDPLGLVVGLSIVVLSIMLATVCEVKKLIFKEAV